MNENIDHMALVPMSAELTMFYHDFESSLAIAAQQERERIIKLLKGLIETRPDESNGGWRGYSIERIIEIIEGE